MLLLSKLTATKSEYLVTIERSFGQNWFTMKDLMEAFDWKYPMENTGMMLLSLTRQELLESKVVNRKKHYRMMDKAHEYMKIKGVLNA